VFPTFRARAPWWGPDLQTLRNAVVRPSPSVEGFSCERLKLPLADGSGDALSGLLQRPQREAAQPLVVLIHGLSGSEESAYMLTSAVHWLGRGHPVLRLNLRGAGPSRPLCRLQYHAGRCGDLRDGLRSLPSELLDRGVVLVGYSLGANMLLKFMAEHAPELPVRAAIAVSAPIDLSAASRRFLDPRNALYHWNLLRNMKRESLGSGAHVSPAERAAILSVTSIYEFDDRFVGPRNGYAGAEEYYADNAAQGYLDRIRIPTLVIQASDDPWIPSGAYHCAPWEAHPDLTLLMSDGGGHVGFHGHESPIPWHDRCAAAFAEDLGFSATAVDDATRFD